MTIYAIVNNLINGSQNQADFPAIWTLISGACILQGGNPFFVPDFSPRFEARLALAAKIGKLGKGIAPRFAHRYVASVAPCIIFAAPDLLKSLQEKGLPWTQALSYDKCLAIGKFTEIPFSEIDDCKINLRIEYSDSSYETEWNENFIHPTVADSISLISVDNTLKTGDLILLGLAPEGPSVLPGQRATLCLNGTESLKFNIR
ncbi:MAG: fumarylacetoacetate hydrolase family protein [Muribaculaceae bacterium]|nr:fumarylacetoacetate hydrolase family protein [Muribaculaceae bacterium]